jgi:hypothetical protein
LTEKIDRELQVILHMFLDRIETLFTMAITCDRGPFSVRLPRSLDDNTLWCKFTDQELHCRPHAAEARLRSCSAPTSLRRSMFIRGSHSLRPGPFPDVFWSHDAFLGQKDMMQIGRRRRRLALPSSCQKIDSNDFLERQSSRPSPLFPRRIYESGLVFLPDATMLAGRRMT